MNAADQLTAANLPPGGRRYEVVNGKLLVTGAQPSSHRAAVIALMVRLKNACPPDQLVAVDSLDFRPTRGLSLRPDILVCNLADSQAHSSPPRRSNWQSRSSPRPPAPPMSSSNEPSTNKPA